MKNIFFVLCFFLPCVVSAATPPPFCQYGKVSSSFPEPAECTNSNNIEIRNQYISLGLCKSSPGISNSNMNGYIEVGIGKYLLINDNVNVKADGNFLGNGNGAKELISFYDSVAGFKGNDRTNFEGNAYFSYNLSGGYYSGPGQIWVINNQYFNACSKKDVFFQNKPTINLSGASTPFNLTPASMNALYSQGFPLYYEVDWNSKAVKESTPSTITLYSRYANSSRRDVVGTVQVYQQRGTVSIRPSGYIVSSGVVRFYAEINDGTYSTGEIHLGNYTHSTSMPSACAQACPSSLGSYRAQCQASSHACNYRVW